MKTFDDVIAELKELGIKCSVYNYIISFGKHQNYEFYNGKFSRRDVILFQNGSDKWKNMNSSMYTRDIPQDISSLIVLYGDIL